MKDIELNRSYVGVRHDLLKLIEKNNVIVLDVGCATGENGRYLLENKIADNVFGIELDEKMANIAKSNGYKKVFIGNLNSNGFLGKLSDVKEKFDYILLGDVLEHLINPIKVLNELKAILKPEGKVIISLPNIAHIELFIQVYLKGTFPQNSRGIFDKTHLRWFTKKDSFKMIENCNLKVVQYERNLRARDAIGSKFDWKYKLLKFFKSDLVTFQHIIVCEHA